MLRFKIENVRDEIWSLHKLSVNKIITRVYLHVRLDADAFAKLLKLSTLHSVELVYVERFLHL